MASRREIREAAVQFLYCTDLEDTSEKEVLYKTFWNIVLESDEKKHRKATAKALLHLNQGRSARYAKLVERAPEARAFIRLDSSSTKLLDKFESILLRENGWQLICDTINRLLSSEVESAVDELEEALDNLYTLNHILINYRKDYFKLLQDFPTLDKQLAPLNSQITALDRVGVRLLMVEEPESYPEQTDVSHLRETVKKIEEYRDSVDVFVTGVINKKETIDAAITAVVNNYKPERIDPVDRAAIRLATFEILFLEAVPNAVAINEAIEIVKKFGSNESARFTNGILDAVAKNIEKAV